jgi:hypothetical protein
MNASAVSIQQHADCDQQLFPINRVTEKIKKVLSAKLLGKQN